MCPITEVQHKEEDDEKDYFGVLKGSQSAIHLDGNEKVSSKEVWK